MLRILRRLHCEWAHRDDFATWSDGLAWFRLAYLDRFRLGFHSPQPPIELRFKTFRHPLALRPGTHDFAVASEILMAGEYDLLDAMDLPQDPTVIDLGGNIGLFSCLVAHRFPSAHIVAVEPEPSNFDMLKRNLLRSAPGAACLLAAVGSRRGRGHLNTSAGTWGTRVTGSDESNGVPILTMPDILSHLDGPRVDLMKCDIEGSEVEVFADCGAWIHTLRRLIIEVHPPYSLDELDSDLRRAGAAFTRRRGTRQKPLVGFYTFDT